MNKIIETIKANKKKILKKTVIVLSAVAGLVLVTKVLNRAQESNENSEEPTLEVLDCGEPIPETVDFPEVDVTTE